MSVSTKRETKDETRIGEYAAAQPLSGTNLVMQMRFKGQNSTAFVAIEETKKAS